MSEDGRACMVAWSSKDGASHEANRCNPWRMGGVDAGSGQPRERRDRTRPLGTVRVRQALSSEVSRERTLAGR